MKHTSRIVPVSLCVASVMWLSGCDRTDSSSATVKPVNQITENPAADGAKTVAIDAAPAAAAAQTTDVSKTRPPAASNALLTATNDLSIDAGIGHGQSKDGKANPPSQIPQSTTLIVKADPPELDLGEIPTSDTKPGKVHLVNTGDTPMTVVNARPTCGCTATTFKPNTVIAPGESIDVDVQMSGPPTEGPVQGKSIIFVVDGQPEVVVPIKATAVSFVKATPNPVDPSGDEGAITLRSIDNQPFKIMNTTPDGVVEFDNEARSEQELKISWAKFREKGVNRQMFVYLDHPKCKNVSVMVNFTPEEIAAQTEKQRQEWEKNQNAITKNPIQPMPVAPPDADTLLANMVREGRNAEVLAKIATDLDVNYRNAGGVPLISMAAEVGNADLVKALIATNKADINATDHNGRTPLMHAAASKNPEVTHALLAAKANPSIRDTLGATALWWAAMRGESETVQALLDDGADVEVVQAFTGWTPLMVAAAFGDANSIEPLIKAHAKLEVTDMLEGATPLVRAAQTGSIESIKILIKNKANLESTDRNGNTPLLACAGYSGGEADKLKVFIEAGANLHAKDNRGYNALALARKRTDMRAAEVVNLLEPLLGAETPAEASAPAAPAPAAAAASATPATHDHAPGDGHNHDATPN